MCLLDCGNGIGLFTVSGQHQLTPKNHCGHPNGAEICSKLLLKCQSFDDLFKLLFLLGFWLWLSGLGVLCVCINHCMLDTS